MIRWSALPVLALLAARPGAAQVVPSDTALKRCVGQRITKISIEPIGPEFAGPAATSGFVTGAVRRFHVASKRYVLREFLQVRVGDICTEITRRETERVLRAQWFIQDARVLVYPDGDGVQLIVTTVDDISIMADAAFRGSSVRAASIGNTNFLGSGTLIQVGWRDNGGLRDSRTLRLRTATTFGRPLQTRLTWNRNSLGNQADAELRYPFLTDLQRFGFRALTGREDDYVQYLRASGSLPLQRATRTYSSVGGVTRIGRPGALLLVGASVSYDGERVGEGVIVTDSGAQPFQEPLPILPAAPFNGTRMNLLIGGRAMRFLPVEGFDALTGVQDLRIGVQFGGQFGRPLKLQGLTSDDYFVSGDVYSGFGTERLFVGTEWLFSGRKSRTAGWDGRIVTGRTAIYAKPNRRATTIASVEYTGGKDVRVPFQVPLGRSRVGLRGFRDSYDAGQSRMILRFEQRQLLGRPFGFADVGTALFAETGRIWAGSAPFGVTSPWRAVVGSGILLSAPPRSRRVYRADLAYALNPDARSGRLELRLSSGNFTRDFWVDADESRRARERSLITNLFAF